MCAIIHVYIKEGSDLAKIQSRGWFLSIRDQLFLILLPSFLFLVMLNDAIPAK